MKVPVIRLEVYFNDETQLCEVELTEGNVFHFSKKEYKDLLKQAIDSMSEEEPNEQKKVN